jgi:hypothetical protein
MNWYYADQGQPAGPVDDSQLEQLRRSGKVGADTLVWCEGMTNWAPCGQVIPEAPPAPPPVLGPSGAAVGPGEALCAECGGVFPVENMIPFRSVHVCANCKPTFMQKLAEGVEISRGAARELSEREILEREYKIDLGEALSRSWNLFKQNSGMAIGTVVVVGLIMAACWGAAMAVSVVVPFANNFLSIFYGMPLAGGLYWFFLRLVRGEPATVADGLAGLSRKYGQLVLLGLVYFLLNMLCMAPFLILIFAFGLGGGFRSGQPAPEMVGGLLIGMGFTMLFAMCLLACVYTLFIFAPLLIMDKGYRFWPALRLSAKMVARRWWMTFAFMLVAGILYFLGFLVFCVGALASGPIYLGMKAVLYDENFRDLARME